MNSTSIAYSYLAVASCTREWTKEYIINYIKWFINLDPSHPKSQWRKEDDLTEPVIEKLPERAGGMWEFELVLVGALQSR